MRSIIRSRSANGPTVQTTPSYLQPGADATWQFNSLAEGSMPWATAGSFTNLVVRIETALTGANNAIFTLYINGVATALTVTLTSASTSGSVSGLEAVAAGDTVALHVVRSTGSNQSVGFVHSELTFESTTAAEHSYATGIGSNHTNGNVGANNTGLNPFHPATGWTSSIEDGVVAAACTISALYLKLSVAVGGSGTRTFLLYKNGTAQDGSGGTPDTRVAISSGTTGSAAFSLAVSAGDTLHLRAQLTGSPASSSASWALAATATTDGEMTVNVRQGTFGNNTRYASAYGSQESVLSGEASHQRAEPSGGWTWKRLYARPNGTIGGSGVAMNVRIGGVNTAVTGTTGTGSGVQTLSALSVVIAAADVLSIQAIGTSGVASLTYTIGYALSTAPGAGTGDVNDPVTVTEGVTPSLTPLLRAVDDVVTVTELAAHGVHLYGDTVTVTDVVTVGFTPTVIRVAENVHVTDRLLAYAPLLAVLAVEIVDASDGPVQQTYGTPSGSGYSPTPPPPPGHNLQDYWTVGIV